MSEQSFGVPQIQVTKDYQKFKLMAGNRMVDYNQVKRLKREMERNPHLFPGSPILVNENDFIIDGQHRRQAAQELGRPVYYVVVKGITLDETRALNVTQKHWKLMDFARSYAEGGKEDYQKFVSAVNKYPNISASIIMRVLAGGQRHKLSEDFRLGEFLIDDMKEATEHLDRLEAIRDKGQIVMNTPMAMSLMSMFKMKESSDVDEMFDYEKFMKKLDHKGAKEVFTPGSTVRNSLRSIEDVYNFMSNTRVRLY